MLRDLEYSLHEEELKIRAKDSQHERKEYLWKKFLVILKYLKAFQKL